MEKEKKVKSKNDIDKKKLIKVVVTVFVVVIIFVTVIMRMDDIRVGMLLKNKSIFTAISTDNLNHSTEYPRSYNTRYINITEDGVLYCFEDNGYNSGDLRRKNKLLLKQKIDEDTLELLKFEIVNLTYVYDMGYDKEGTKYYEIRLNDSGKTVYADELDNVLRSIGIEIEEE